MTARTSSAVLKHSAARWAMRVRWLLRSASHRCKLVTMRASTGAVRSALGGTCSTVSAMCVGPMVCISAMMRHVRCSNGHCCE